MNRINNFFSNIGMLVTSCIVILLIVEVILRIVYSNENDNSQIATSDVPIAEKCKDAHAPYETPGQCYFTYDQIAYMEYAPYFGYIPVANHKGNGYYINAQGFRYNDDLTIDKPKNEFRIFITGGSTSFGAGVNQQQMYSTIAENLFKNQFLDRKIRVIPTGVGGHVSLHEILMIRNNILDYKPDAIVMFTGWNDIYGGYRGIDYFKNPDMLEIGKLIRKSVTDDVIQLKRLNGTQSKWDIPPKYSDYFFKLHYLIDRYIQKNIMKSKAESQTSTVKIQELPIDYTVNYILENINTAYNIATRNHSQFVVFLQPTLYNTQKPLSKFELDIIQKMKTNYPNLAEYQNKGFEILRDKLKSLAKEKNFIYINADNAISNTSETLFVDHVHFGDRGNRLIGEYLHNTLSNNLHMPADKQRS